MISKNMARAVVVASVIGGGFAVALPAYAASVRASADCFRLIGTSRLEWGGTATNGNRIEARLYDRSTHLKTISKSAASALISISDVRTGVVGGRRYHVTATAYGAGGATNSNTCYVT